MQEGGDKDNVNHLALIFFVFATFIHFGLLFCHIYMLLISIFHSESTENYHTACLIVSVHIDTLIINIL